MTPERRQAVVQAVREGLLLAGAVLLSVGAGMVYQPAGVIVGGLLLLAGGLRGLR